MTEQQKQNSLKDDRITVHSGEFKLEQRTDETHSLTAEEYRKKTMLELQALKENLKKK